MSGVAAAAQTAVTTTNEAAHPEDAKLRAIYTAEDAWRHAQRGAEDEAHPHHVSAELPAVDPATQQKALQHWAGVLHELDAIHAADLSGEERVNFEVFREQIQVLENAQVFREYEKPANSDSAFWSEVESEAQESFRTREDYENYVRQL